MGSRACLVGLHWWCHQRMKGCGHESLPGMALALRMSPMGPRVVGMAVLQARGDGRQERPSCIVALSHMLGSGCASRPAIGRALLDGDAGGGARAQSRALARLLPPLALGRPARRGGAAANGVLPGSRSFGVSRWPLPPYRASHAPGLLQHFQPSRGRESASERGIFKPEQCHSVTRLHVRGFLAHHMASLCSSTCAITCPLQGGGPQAAARHRNTLGRHIL